MLRNRKKGKTKETISLSMACLTEVQKKKQTKSFGLEEKITWKNVHKFMQSDFRVEVYFRLTSQLSTP